MINYKVREEKKGAFLFDRKNGKAEQLTEEQYLSMLNNSLIKNNPEWQFIPKKNRDLLPDDCFSAPSRIYFELSRKCNLGCKACFNESSLPLDKELTTKEVLDILNQLNKAGTFEIRFTGGEPTTRKDFLTIIQYAKKLGFYISMGTNGVYNATKSKKIINSGIDWFIVSLEGREKVSDYIRGKGNYKKALKTLKAISKQKKRIRINTVIGKYNKDEIKFLAKLADSLGAESLNLIPLRPYGRAAKLLSDQMLSRKEFYEMIKTINGLRKVHKVKFVTTIDLLNKDNLSKQDRIIKKERTCAAGVEGAVISPLGDIYGCSYSPASDPSSKDKIGKEIFVAGNLRKQKFSDVWLNSKKWAVFRDLKQYKNKKCLSCNHYKHECVGSCPVMSYYENGTLDNFDPYCFKDLLLGEKA
ncbi:MAG: radical SAM protein [Candidatus Diapherotrites archaeon]|nr:radical SAM protein [Candidatus Diapherotrites archaeon]